MRYDWLGTANHLYAKGIAAASDSKEEHPAGVVLVLDVGRSPSRAAPSISAPSLNAIGQAQPITFIQQSLGLWIKGGLH